LHGPHHSAEKSTKTGSGDFNNSANLLMVIQFSVDSCQWTVDSRLEIIDKRVKSKEFIIHHSPFTIS
jgi:hypothetical protein